MEKKHKQLLPEHGGAPARGAGGWGARKTEHKQHVPKTYTSHSNILLHASFLESKWMYTRGAQTKHTTMQKVKIIRKNKKKTKQKKMQKKIKKKVWNAQDIMTTRKAKKTMEHNENTKT